MCPSMQAQKLRVDGEDAAAAKRLQRSSEGAKCGVSGGYGEKVSRQLPKL